MLDTTQLMQILGNQDLTKKKSNDSEAVDKILMAIREHKEISAKDLSKLTGLSMKVVGRTITKLIVQQRIVAIIRARSQYTYTLPPPKD